MSQAEKEKLERDIAQREIKREKPKDGAGDISIGDGSANGGGLCDFGGGWNC